MTDLFQPDRQTSKVIMISLREVGIDLTEEDREIFLNGPAQLVFDLYFRSRPGGDDSHYKVCGELSERMRFKQIVREEGRVCVYCSGMDCDGMRSWGVANSEGFTTLEDWRAWVEEAASWDDGPHTYSFLRPSELDEAHRESGCRDLGMEAFEDGHPHVIYS